VALFKWFFHRGAFGVAMAKTVVKFTAWGGFEWTRMLQGLMQTNSRLQWWLSRFSDTPIPLPIGSRFKGKVHTNGSPSWQLFFH
jgi:hypothetical protein